MSTTPSQIAPSSLLSPDELSKATQYLVVTRDGLVETVHGLTDSQWNFKPEPGDWSIAEILEHVVLVEKRVHGIVGRMPDAPRAEHGRMNSEIEAIILAEVPDRSTKVKAPPQVCPPHECTPEEALARFLEGRTRTLELLVEAPAIRGHVFPHPILGPWDGYQWILAAGAHGARHTNQILELKACSGFPQRHNAPSVSLH